MRTSIRSRDLGPANTWRQLSVRRAVSSVQILSRALTQKERNAPGCRPALRATDQLSPVLFSAQSGRTTGPAGHLVRLAAIRVAKRLVCRPRQATSLASNDEDPGPADHRPHRSQRLWKIDAAQDPCAAAGSEQWHRSVRGQGFVGPGGQVVCAKSRLSSAADSVDKRNACQRTGGAWPLHLAWRAWAFRQGGLGKGRGGNRTDRYLFICGPIGRIPCRVANVSASGWPCSWHRTPSFCCSMNRSLLWISPIRSKCLHWSIAYRKLEASGS
jgi:hypothetical protein